ncbi:MAG TPA: exodeoxyribonuclease III [Bacteroidales bacterium]|nr:exodeoxyribonuclease III [Bacteroidales bacterium]
MNVYSYNLNGIRAAINKGLLNWLSEKKPDLISFQELKASPDQFNVHDFEELGYYCLWNPADKKGYSGVATLSKEKPLSYSFGMNKEIFDIEGRIIRTDFTKFTHISVYVPSGSMGDMRQDFKMSFLEAFYGYIKKLLVEKPNLIVSGDFNICHKPIDINHPERHEDVSGFLPEERVWVDSFLQLGFIDSFRFFNQQPNQYSWWSYRQQARAKNLGWRIDYHFVSEALKNKLEHAAIYPEIVHSDHCPVEVSLK